MFFIGIFGIENKSLFIKDIQNKICKSCGAMTSYKLVKSYNFFHFFFIPLFKWNIEYYVISRCCSNVFIIPREIGLRIEKGEEVQLTDDDLKPIGGAASNTCPGCGQYVAPEFTYCPYCGSKVR